MERCLAHTRADAVMSAIGLLLDPRLFTRANSAGRDAIELALEYCEAAQVCNAGKNSLVMAGKRAE